jgi:hypothetical protein
MRYGEISSITKQLEKFGDGGFVKIFNDKHIAFLFEDHIPFWMGN